MQTTPSNDLSSSKFGDEFHLETGVKQSKIQSYSRFLQLIESYSYAFCLYQWMSKCTYGERLFCFVSANQQSETGFIVFVDVGGCRLVKIQT